MKNIFVGNLSFNTGEEELRQAFESYGQVDRVSIMTDRDTGRSRGFGFVEMTNNEDGEKAASEDPITQFVQSLVSADAGNAGNENSNPFHGYYFRLVTKSAEQSGRGERKVALTLVAYPVEHQSSGVMTFVVSRDGVVYEKDLGPGTTKVAPQIKAPTGASWHPAL